MLSVAPLKQMTYVYHEGDPRRPDNREDWEELAQGIYSPDKGGRSVTGSFPAASHDSTCFNVRGVFI